MKSLGYIFLWLIGGCIVQSICYILQINYWDDFYNNNLILLLVSLMAINITTISVIMTKLKEISEKSPVRFDATKNSMRISITEQVSLIAASAILLMLTKSKLQFFIEYKYVLQCFLHAVFIGAIHILMDTAKGVFKLLDFEQTKNNANK